MLDREGAATNHPTMPCNIQQRRKPRVKIASEITYRAGCGDCVFYQILPLSRALLASFKA